MGQTGRRRRDAKLTSYSPSKKLFLSSALQDSHCRRALFWFPACSSFSADPCPLATLDIPPEGPATGPDWPTIPWEAEPFSAPVPERRLVPRNTPVRKHLRGGEKKAKLQRNLFWYDQNVLPQSLVARGGQRVVSVSRLKTQEQSAWLPKKQPDKPTAAKPPKPGIIPCKNVGSALT